MNLEEFNQLAWFKNDTVSSFILDLVRTLINYEPKQEVVTDQKHEIEFLFNIGTVVHADEKGNYRKLECILPTDEKVRSRALEALKDEKAMEARFVYDTY